MSIKRFIKLQPGPKNSSDGLLAAHYLFLKQHEFLGDILSAYREGELPPTPTLQTCQELLFLHMTELELQKATTTLKKNLEVKESVPSGNYLITLMVHRYDEFDQLDGIEIATIETHRSREVQNAAGEMVEERYIETETAIWSADDYGSAERLAHRKLVAREDSVYAIIENTIGQKVETNIMRGDAFASLFKAKKGPISKQPSRSTKTLKWVGKAQQTRVVGARF
jgi:hypothetical protein